VGQILATNFHKYIILSRVIVCVHLILFLAITLPFQGIHPNLFVILL